MPRKLVPSVTVIKTRRSSGSTKRWCFFFCCCCIDWPSRVVKQECVKRRRKRVNIRRRSKQTNSPTHTHANTRMKYAIIIPDGAADEPLAELGGKTPLEAAKTPNMDRIAMEGRVGLVRTIPEGFESGSDVATMCLLGYSPKEFHTGRAPLE